MIDTSDSFNKLLFKDKEQSLANNFKTKHNQSKKFIS
jgi:hypothetical protein